eukprot:TRINITY_DN22093_c0_g1_i1.p1 TRINITY_DN22093_c0_g1~~TRINITY_DN22093_c0_g1_i1.p1  ORF type:complete len:106 (+),score=24.13 TRINITY_DN22093_c0_g1_i1:157-474(+)
MLRSLVGSEMCIRDRCSYQGIPSSSDDGHPLDAQQDRTYVGCREHTHTLKFIIDLQSHITPLTTFKKKSFRICLLYTSDAADEEDSVDLGGRRIIKKKKNRIHKE